jgi:hypothetical protein
MLYYVQDVFLVIRIRSITTDKPNVVQFLHTRSFPPYRSIENNIRTKKKIKSLPFEIGSCQQHADRWQDYVDND